MNNFFKMSISYLARERRNKFNGPNYKDYFNYVYYLGPPNNDRTEYFAYEHLALAWILRRTQLKIVSSIRLEEKKSLTGDNERLYPNCVIALDRIIIHWDYTFHLNENNIVYYGYAEVCDTHIIINAGSYSVYIYDSDNNQGIDVDDRNVDIVYEYKCILFESTAIPQLSSTILVDEYDYKTLYVLNIEWSNSKTRPINCESDKIFYKNYYMIVRSNDIDRIRIETL